MKIILSPAKKLNFSSDDPAVVHTVPVFEKEADIINEALSAYTPRELEQLMSVSPALAEMNWTRIAEWRTTRLKRPAVFAFDGAVFKSLDVRSLRDEALDYLQDSLRIISGKYGLLRPFDLIKPYRLEMGTKIAVGGRKNLYEFWKKRLTEALQSEMEDGEILINLASVEYAKSLDFRRLGVRVITPVFKEYRNNRYQTVSIYAKMARGMMLRFLAKHRIADPEILKTFGEGGYAYDTALSEKDQWVFTR